MNNYYLLVSSLPPLPTDFKVERPPISRERLERRLRLLEPGDAAQLRATMDLFEWGRQFSEADDAVVVKRCAQLEDKITNGVLREIVGEILDERAIMAALRRRHRGMGHPTVPWRRVDRDLRRQFSRPDFGLGARYPWITQADKAIRNGELRAYFVQRMESLWTALRRRADHYYFSFEAVVLYVARWDVVYRWHQLRPERGRELFEGLLKEVLGEYANA